VFRYRPLGRRDIFTLIIPGSLSVLAPLLYGFWRLRQGLLNYGPVAAGYWSRPWYILAVVAALVFIYAAIARIQSAGHFVIVYEGGLGLKLKRRHALRWEEMAGVSTETTGYHFLGIPLGQGYQGMLHPNTGKPIRLTNAIQDLPELLTLLKARLYPRLMPHLKANLESGQWIYFGPIAIRRDGFALRKRGKFPTSQPVPWSRLRRLDVTSGYLVVELSDQPHRKLPVSQIPNVELLLQLIQLGVNT